MADTLIKQVEVLNGVLEKFDSRLRVIESNSTNLALSLWFFNTLLIIILILSGLHFLSYSICLGIEICNPPSSKKQRTREEEPEEST